MNFNNLATLDWKSKEKKEKAYKEQVEHEKAMTELRDIELQNEQKKEKQELKKKELDDKRIQTVELGKEALEKALENIVTPVSFNLEKDLLLNAKEYESLSAQKAYVDKNLREVKQIVLSAFRIFFAEVGISIIVIFLVTRITAQNEELLEELTSFFIVRSYFPDLLSGLEFDFTLQEISITTLLAGGIGSIMCNSKKFKSSTTIKYAAIALFFSIVGMAVANALSMI